MAVTVSGKNYTQISSCDTLSSGGTWTGVDTEDSVDKKEGSASLCGTLKASGNNDTTFTPSSAVDLSGTKHVRFWFLITSGSLVNTFANGGIQFWASDGTNTGYWYVGGRDTYPGGWHNFVVDVSKAVDAGTKPTSMNAITSMGTRHNLTAAGKNVDNTWIDNLCVCDGLITYGDDSGGYYDFDDIFSVCNDPSTGGWGILTRKAGVYCLTGSLEVGDASGTSGTKFNAKSQVVVFENRPDKAGTGSNINTGLLNITIVDNGTGTTEFILGSKSGTAGIEGCTIRVQDTAQLAKFDIDASTDTDVDNFKLYGSTFIGADATSFPTTGVNVEILSCNFESCGQVDPSSASISNCFFINTTDADSALLWNESIDIDNCSFVGNTTGAGIEMPSAVGSPYAYDALMFSGNTYDVLNSSGSTISINKNNGSDPTTYEGSTVNFLGVSVTLSVHVQDAITMASITGAAVMVKAASGGSKPYQASVSIVQSGGTATVTHTAHGLVSNDYVIIEGCTEGEYNGGWQITVTGADTYTYTLVGSPSSPATGTPKSTFAAIYGTTDGSGDISDIRTYTSNQPFTGMVRKATSAPYYKAMPISGTIDKDNGLSMTVNMFSDD